MSATTPVRGPPRCSVRAGAEPPYDSACSLTTSRAGGPYATSAVPSLFGPRSGGREAAAATSSCGVAVSYGHGHFQTRYTRPPLAPLGTDWMRGPTPCGAVADASDRGCHSSRESLLAVFMVRCPSAGMAMRFAPTFLTKRNGRFRLPFWMAIPSGRALVLRTEPRRSRVLALSGFDLYRGHPVGLTPVRRPQVDARPPRTSSAPFWKSRRPEMRTCPGTPFQPSRRRRAATVRRRAREGPVTGLCGPAQRPSGVANRRPG